MENATKALLIAAAVLVVIVLIAFGVRIFNSTSEVSGQAQTIGSGIQEQTQKATSSALSSIEAASSYFGGKKTYTAEEFNNSLYNILNISPIDFSNPNNYKDGVYVNKTRYTDNVIKELKEIKKLCNQTGRKIQIKLTYYDNATFDNIDDCIARITEGEYVNNGGVYLYVSELDEIKVDSDKYICTIIYIVSPFFPIMW